MKSEDAITDATVYVIRRFVNPTLGHESDIGAMLSSGLRSIGNPVEYAIRDSALSIRLAMSDYVLNALRDEKP